jgi:hypothetical protein
MQLLALIETSLSLFDQYTYRQDFFDKMLFLLLRYCFIFWCRRAQGYYKYIQICDLNWIAVWSIFSHQPISSVMAVGYIFHIFISFSHWWRLLLIRLLGFAVTITSAVDWQTVFNFKHLSISNPSSPLRCTAFCMTQPLIISQAIFHAWLSCCHKVSKILINRCLQHTLHNTVDSWWLSLCCSCTSYFEQSAQWCHISTIIVGLSSAAKKFVVYCFIFFLTDYCYLYHGPCNLVKLEVAF